MKFFDKEANVADAISEAKGQSWLCLSHAHLEDKDLDTILDNIASFSQLTELDLSNNLLTDVGVEKVKTYCSLHPNIQTLILNSIPMTEKSAIGLLDIKNITDLQLWKNIHIGDPFARAVLNQNHLAKLDIRDTGINRDLIVEADAHVRACVKENSPGEPNVGNEGKGKCSIM